MWKLFQEQIGNHGTFSDQKDIIFVGPIKDVVTLKKTWVKH